MTASSKPPCNDIIYTFLQNSDVFIQYWLIINEALWNLPEGNFKANAQDIYLWYVLKITNSRLQSYLQGASELSMNM